jgi:hypothetical protein
MFNVFFEPRAPSILETIDSNIQIIFFLWKRQGLQTFFHMIFKLRQFNIKTFHTKYANFGIIIQVFESRCDKTAVVELVSKFFRRSIAELNRDDLI